MNFSVPFSRRMTMFLLRLLRTNFLKGKTNKKIVKKKRVKKADCSIRLISETFSNQKVLAVVGIMEKFVIPRGTSCLTLISFLNFNSLFVFKP